jgi:type II secretory pathway pseudopilin PulG
VTGSSPVGLEGCGLIEVIMALTVLSVGLLATAGLVRAVSWQAELARSEGDAALLAQQQIETALSERTSAPSSLAQQQIETALSERTSAPSSRGDTLHFGNREYAVGVTLEAAGPALERIRIDVVQVGPPGFGNRLPNVRSYGTRRRRPLPRLVPPASAIP